MPLGKGSCATKVCHNYATCDASSGKTTCSCFHQCDKEFKPVCGSNYRTYINDCHLKSESCNTQAKVTVVNQGVCSMYPNLLLRI